MAASKTEVLLMLKSSKDWKRVKVIRERRQYSRFSTQAVPARLTLLRAGERGLELAPCTLINVSYGGMCFGTASALEDNTDYRFLLELAAPFDELVLVGARVLWRRPTGRPDQLAGAVFVESSKGWLGPGDDSEE